MIYLILLLLCKQDSMSFNTKLYLDWQLSDSEICSLKDLEFKKRLDAKNIDPV